jgi:addiction module RelE/StbE family toxin
MPTICSENWEYDAYTGLYPSIRKRGKNLDKLKIIVRTLLVEEVLDPIHRDHKLIGNWQGRRECHIESDRYRIGAYPVE